MRSSAFALALAALVLVGGGCTPETASNDGADDSRGTANESVKTPVGYAETKANLLDGKDDYHTYTFTQATGDCTSKGLPATLTYREDADLGFFIMDSADGSYFDEIVMATPSTISFDQLTLGGTPATCAISAGYGTNDGSLGCSAVGSDEFNPQPLCSGTVKITATPR